MTRVRIAIEAPPQLRPRIEWVLESLLATAACTCEVISASAGNSATTDVGVGCEGRVRFDLVPDEWQATRNEPAGQDVLAQAFWWLARVEELHLAPEDFDERGRVRYDATALADAATPTPVDSIAHQLRDALGLDVRSWPGGAPYALALSHDIDAPVRWSRVGVRRAASRVLRSARDRELTDAARTTLALAELPAWKLLRRDPYLNIARIAELERARGGRSTCYVIAAHHHAADGDAEPYVNALPKIVQEIRDCGLELGLHGSYTSSERPGSLHSERAELEAAAGAPVMHQRHHYLRHLPPRDWPRIAEAGFSSDSSLGHASHVGYRSGFSHPYRAWNHEANAPLDLVLVPMTMMDASLGAPYYMNLSPASSWDVVRPQLDHALEHGSAISVLWHNDAFAPRVNGGWQRLYERILDRAHDDGAWLASVGDVVAAWSPQRVG